MKILKNVAQIAIKHPLAFGIGVSTFKTSASDLLVQTVGKKMKKMSNIEFVFF